jgi:hypothetical protein
MKPSPPFRLRCVRAARAGICSARAASLDLERIRSMLGLLEQALTRGDLLSVFERQLARVAED